MKLFMKSALTVAGIGIAGFAFAADPIVGQWQTFDDDGKTPKGVVKIVEAGGVFTGTIVSTADPKGKKFIGRTVISNLKAKGGGKYSGGKITDPEKNKSYRMTSSIKGNTMKLKGYLGPFSRSQVWKKK